MSAPELVPPLAPGLVAVPAHELAALRKRVFHLSSGFIAVRSTLDIAGAAAASDVCDAFEGVAVQFGEQLCEMTTVAIAPPAAEINTCAVLAALGHALDEVGDILSVLRLARGNDCTAPVADLIGSSESIATSIDERLRGVVAQLESGVAK